MSPPIATLPDWPAPDDAVPGAEAIEALSSLDLEVDEAGTWSEELWEKLRALGAPSWSIPATHGGDQCPRPVLARRYARVAEGSLTAAFILTQHDAAVRHLSNASAQGSETASHWLDEIASGRAFATVGISQLTTSRRRGAHAVRAVASEGGGYRLDGVMPWVTAAPRADLFVTGGVTDAGEQILVALPRSRAGVEVRPPFALAALQASCTTEVVLDGVEITRDEILAGPAPEVLTVPGAAGTGGLDTSALALGQARAAIAALAGENVRREDLAEPIETLAASWTELAADLLATAEGRPHAPAPGLIRGRANTLVLRATQSYLTARKGTGFLRSEPAQRWARQALFFLVWSCPAPVAQATLRDLVGICPS